MIGFHSIRYAVITFYIVEDLFDNHIGCNDSLHSSPVRGRQLRHKRINWTVDFHVDKHCSLPFESLKKRIGCPKMTHAANDIDRSVFQKLMASTSGIV